MDENKEELRFVPSAVSDSAGWHEIKCRRHRQCWKEGLKFCDVASTIVEDDGRAAHDKSLPEFLQFNARRKKGTSDERQAMEDPRS